MRRQRAREEHERVADRAVVVSGCGDAGDGEPPGSDGVGEQAERREGTRRDRGVRRESLSLVSARGFRVGDRVRECRESVQRVSRDGGRRG